MRTKVRSVNQAATEMLNDDVSHRLVIVFGGGSLGLGLQPDACHVVGVGVAQVALGDEVARPWALRREQGLRRSEGEDERVAAVG
jgi:hypothetical protein